MAEEAQEVAVIFIQVTGGVLLPVVAAAGDAVFAGFGFEAGGRTVSEEGKGSDLVSGVETGA